MIRWVILAVLVVVVAAVVPLAVSYLPADVAGPVPASRADESAGPPPVVVVEGEPTHDFGLMSEQDEGTNAWVVRNDGQGPLRLRFIEKPCTCTGVRIGEDGEAMNQGDDVVIEPGEQAEVLLTWETRDKIGEFSTFARFATNDYEHNPTLTFTVEGLVSPAVVIDPPRLEFPAAPSDAETTLSTTIYSPTHPEMTLVSEPTTSRPGILAAEARPLTEEELAEINARLASQSAQHDHAGMPHSDEEHGTHEVPTVSSGYRLDVTLKPGLPLGRFSDAVTVKTDHPIRPEHEVAISGQIVGPIAAMPDRVYMPGVSSREGRSTTVTLNVRNQEQTRFTVRIPESLSDVLKIAIEPTEAEADARFRQYRMEVRVPQGARPSTHKGTIVLETDHPQAEEVKVPIELLIRGG